VYICPNCKFEMRWDHDIQDIDDRVWAVFYCNYCSGEFKLNTSEGED